MATLEKVQAQIAKLQAQAEALAAKQSSGVIAKIREIMDKHGLTTADIEAHIGGAKKRGRKPGVKAAGKAAVKASASVAKYRDPKTGATWTGHGRAPAWIASAKDRSKFLVEGAASASAPAPAGKKVAKAAKVAKVAKVAKAGKAVKVAKAGNYVRGPQAPKYRDPKSGATWSGRGPAPAWLAGAKDRTKFLIEGATENTAQPKAAAAKKAAAPTSKAAVAKKPAAQKRAVKKAAAPATKAPAKKAATRKVAAKKVSVSTESAAPAVAPEVTNAPVSA